MPEIRGRDIRLMLIGGALGALGAMGGLGALGAMAGLSAGGRQPLSPSALGQPCGLSSGRARAYFGGAGEDGAASRTEGSADAAESVPGDGAAQNTTPDCDDNAHDEAAFVPLRCRRDSLPGEVSR
ncbi:hypothetical protein CURE108131_19310 [Cupriavidus respiraculi]|uniref:Uncharacterized protein n=1 Tax=Cupriavidus respiraculi TaxID=195930 RepID=A0ABN7ZDF1_9BURK|nr:hypothetical protein LMG21510_04998 [Cupriavidus respiraculi]